MILLLEWPMTYKDVIEELRKRGHLATKARIYFAVDNYKVSRPDKDTSGRYIWGEFYIDQLDSYFKAVEAKKK
jgi:hypothetical protein